MKGYGLQSYGGLSWGSQDSPKFLAPLAANYVRPQKFWRCKNVLEVLYHRAKFGGVQTSTTVAATKKHLSFLCFMCVHYAFELRLYVWFRHKDVGI